jgi:beta-galactosidase
MYTKSVRVGSIRSCGILSASLRCVKPWPSLLVVLFAVAAMCSVNARAQVETSLPTSQRVTINLSAGMPGQRPWLYIKDSNSPAYATTSFNDSAWTPVGIPYSANFLTSFLNADSGGGDGDLNGTYNWYRLHFTVGSQYANSKILVEFEGAHTGAQVYINGTLLPGISSVAANAQASHVVGFIPFIVDLTPYVRADGVTENVLAVSVSRNDTWFEQPGFSQDYRFGQADAGLFRPAYMFITNKVHIPVNVYSNQKTWGTYVATVSEVPSQSSTAQAASAVVEVQTNVLNENTTSQQVTLTTQIVDANGNVVATAPPITQTVPPMTSSSFPSTATPMFDQQMTVNNPTLWYPNNSTFGTPYMYKVYHIVSVNGVVVDTAQSPLGIRTITWDQSFPYFNGHPMYLWGASGRYDYPALGSSVPEEQQWRDLAQLAAEGGNIWRPGHSTTSEEFVNAADVYGIMIDQPSGDGEGAFNTPTADQVTLKEELHRDMILRDRSHPSILDWESNNGTMNETVGGALLVIDKTWDPINSRVAADRTPDPVNGYMLGCTLEGCEVGVKSEFPNNPAWGAEYWGNGSARGLNWNYELAFAAPFLDNWRQSKGANAFGMAQWYFADSPGEDSLYVEFAGTPSQQSIVRSLGASSVDMNRFPKLLYYVYEAAWTPFSIKPIVHLANHWNLSGVVQENAFSNCPSVRLLVNGVQQGSTEVPNSWNSNSESNLTQTTTLMPFQTSWPVTWASGTVEAECLDQFGNVVATDSRTTAGPESKIVLTVVPELTRPDGTSFTVTANGSDAAFVVAQVEDANGNVEPLASDILTFSVSGPATYMGGSEQYVSTASDAYSTAPGNSELNYHAPGDPQLQVEGGMTKIALRSQFTTGTVTVTATAPGLTAGTTTLRVQPIPSVTPAPTSPTIIVPPANAAVTVGQSATFSVTAAGTAPFTFQWLKNGATIAGATNSTYTTPATTSADNNSNFAVTVTNSVGSATSTTASLMVDASAGVAITAQPASQTAYVGQTVQLSVLATGSPTLAYQWKKSGVAIAGATSSAYTTPVLAAGDNGDSFTVVVSNPVNSVTSATAVLTVAAAIAPTIIQQPASVSVLANDPATFSVSPSGSSPFTYQWMLNGVTLLGANAATYSILAVQSTNVGSYTVVVTNAAGSVTSAAATLTIAPPGLNLALNQPATSSSTQGTGLTANYVNDGDLTTRWASAGGVDPSWVEIDLGSVQAFDNVILYWEAAYAETYQIQYSTDNSTWYVAYSNSNGVGGVENLTFPTVHGRYIRMYGVTRATTYGYSLYEFQVYDIAQCGGSGERYTVLSPTAVLDNMSQLTWQRAETTYANGGAQYTQPIAQTYCASQSMRLPTQAEALAISGASAASCAFPEAWNTWTSTVDPASSSDAAFVSSTGQSTWQVANNYPGGVLCDSGTTVLLPTITTQPASQTVAVGQTATFSVVAIGNGTLSYQWSKNGTAITAATAATYTTPAAAATDNGSVFTVVVTNAGGSITSSSATLTVTGGSCTSLPSAPTGLTATASSSSAINLSWTAVTPPSNCSINSYSVYGSPTSGFTPSSSNLLASGITSTTYSNTGLSAFTSYYYLVKAIDGDGTSASSAQASATTQASASGNEIVAIDSGGPAVSNASGGDASFVADEDVAGGGTDTSTNTIVTAGVTNAAPAAVYQSERAGQFTYTIPSLTAGTQYVVLLHFAEFYFTAAGQRLFNVAINGTTVLNNFDIYAAAGANKALVEQFTATANSSGQIVIAYTNGTVDQAKSSGIEIRSASSGCSTLSSVPTGLTATASSSSAIGLSWTAPTPPANCTISSYNVYSSATSGFAPSASNLIASGVTTTSYSNTGLAASTTHYYVVEAVDGDGASAASAQASAETSATSCTTVPSAPTGLTATASSSTAIALSWMAVTPPANCSIRSYNVYGSTTSGFTPSASNLIASSGTGTTYSNTGLAASTTHYYVVEAVDVAGTSTASTQTSATTQAASGTDIVAINSGGPAVSNSGGGDASFIADEDFSGGGTDSSANTITTAGVTNAAPMAVYQSERAGTFTYIIPGLVAGSTHTVLLHFAEFYWTAAGKRVFNVAINGTTVLSNFDIYATAGANKALVEQFTATANSSGQIVITYTNGTADQPKSSGIEIR